MKYHKVEMAIDVLIHHAVDGKILSNEAFRVTKEAGIGSRTVERAKREAKIKSARGEANERIWIIPNDIKDIRIVKTPSLTPHNPSPDLPIEYINSQEQTDFGEVEVLESNLQNESQGVDISQMKRIFLICAATKFSGKFDAFAVRVPRTLEENMQSGDAFVFCNSIRTQVSVLQWQGDGFAQYFKRSDYGPFPWPVKRRVSAVEITAEDLKMLLEYPRLMLRLSGVITPQNLL